MRRLLLALLFLPMAASVQAEVSCSRYRDSSTWHNCTGTKQLEDGTYAGQWRNGRFHGQGIMQTTNLEYTGGWKNGSPHGVGTKKWVEPDGLETETTCSSWEGVQSYCSKFVTYERDSDDGSIYKITGSHCDFNEEDSLWILDPMMRGCKHGTVEYESRNVTLTRLLDVQGENKQVRTEVVDFEDDTTVVYEGGWKDMTRNGKGAIKYASGGAYVGDWKKGKRHGKGKLTYSDGSVYEGDWKNGKEHGKGVFIHPDGATYDGDWKNGIENGTAKISWPDGSTYIGDVLDGLGTGKGSMTWKSGAKYVGDFVDGDQSGMGKTTWPGLGHHIGEYVDGHASGKGDYFYSNGDVYEGDFKDGKEHGEGKHTRSDGMLINEGIWVDGDYSETLTNTKKGKDFRDGNGVLQNYESAKSFFVLAAQSGNKDAMLHLSEMYKDQKIIDELTLAETIAGWFDDVESKSHLIKAHMWANLAGRDMIQTIENGFSLKEIKRARGLIAGLIHTIEKQLNPEEIKQAQDLAKECLENDYQGC